jgi:hypothetical protein
MATTTNFGWTTPDDTDLVKDGAAAIRTLGSSIDTSLVDLKGGTTGQVLSKTSGTDMDFTWITDATGMSNPMTTTGDVIYSSSGSTPDRLGIGTAGQVLKVNSGATAPEWGSLGGQNFTLLNAGGTTLSGTASRTVSGITGVDQLLVVLEGATMTNSGSRFGFRLNGVTTSTYVNSRMEHGWASTYNAGNYQGNTYTTTYIEAGKNSGVNTSECFASLTIFGISTAGKKPYIVLGGARPDGNTGHTTVAGSNIFDGSAITSVTAFSNGGNWTAGTIYVYGA